MSLRSSGLWCDVCNRPMMAAMAGASEQGGFKLSISPARMNACQECRPLLGDDMKARDLPRGPLRDLLERYEKMVAEQEEQ